MHVIKLSEKIKKINIDGSVDFHVDMKNYTTFRTGGPADIFITAKNSEDIVKIRNFTAENGIPLFFLGGGANILVSDSGIRGITLYTGGMKDFAVNGTDILCGAGIYVNEMAEKALEAGLSGLEFIYGMPGTAGGALWMNARCYGGEISHIFKWAEVVDEENCIRKIEYKPEEWDYKKSPFQGENFIITQACLALAEGDKKTIREIMKKNHDDRDAKGHFRAPSAGSIFKNNRDFGKPSGQIIDEAGLRGLRIGKAVVSSFHANIIINEGGATSSDILSLINLVRDRVEEKTGFRLEPEVIPVGDWR